MKLPSRPSRPRAGALWLAALALAACSPSGRDAAPPPIVLVSIDTLRADRLPAYGFSGVETPAIDALARDGILFEHAYSPAPLTLPAHLSMLSGLLPGAHGVRDNLGYRFDASRHPWAPELLRKAGYRTGAMVSAGSVATAADSGARVSGAALSRAAAATVVCPDGRVLVPFQPPSPTVVNTDVGTQPSRKSGQPSWKNGFCRCS